LLPETTFIEGGSANNGVGEPKRNASLDPAIEIDEILSDL
jgi:hypothetical protein